MSRKREKSIFAVTEDEKDVFLTPWSAVHFLSGAAIKGLGWNFWSNYLIHGAYEVKDHYNKEEVYNSTFNSLGDQVCSMAGWALTTSGNKDMIVVFALAYGAAALLGQGNYIG